ncbi:MAG TPA: LysR family transcriptional regulator [Polyangiaceae bacterium]|nr:LysR family transcriptional regulator [Polyangiaceae bacterium]
MPDPVETAELAAFVKTVDAHSLSRAAAELGIPRATLSRRLARLEERLGARLLRRSTRSLALTDAGESFNRHARIVLEAVAHAEASVRQVDDAVRGSLRVSVPPMVMPSFRSMICSFAERYPDVRLQIHFTSRLVDLRRDGYDVALRATSALEPGLIARSLSREPMLAVASPAYLAAHGMPKNRRDLARHRCLMGFARGELPQSQWTFAGGNQVHLEGVFHSNELDLLCDAAVRGLGIAFLPLMITHAALESGALVAVLPDTLYAEAMVALVYPEREFIPPAVRAFIDAVVEWAPGELGRKLPGSCRAAWDEQRQSTAAAASRGRKKRAATNASRRHARNGAR